MRRLLLLLVRVLPLVLVLVLAPLSGGLGAAQSRTPRAFSRGELARIDRGELVVRAETREERGLRLLGGTSWISVDAPPDAVYRAAIDYRRWPHFVPRVSSIRILRGGNDALVVIRHVFGPADTSYGLRMRSRPARRDLAFNLEPSIPHTVQAAWGFFNVRPNGHGGSIVSYGVMVDVGGGVVRSVFESSVHRWLLRVPQELKRWCESAEGRRRYGGLSVAAAH